VLGSVTFHVAVGVGLFSTAWWWASEADELQPPELAVALKEEVPEVSQDAPDFEVQPPIELEPVVLPVVEVEASHLAELEELPPAKEYLAVRPWMPQQLRYRPSTLPPHLREQTKPVEEQRRTDSAIPRTVAPQASAPRASVLLAPQIVAEQCPPPEYPRRARRMRWEGVTQLIVTVDVNGNPIAIKVSVSSGHQILDDAAIQAVQTWHFHPANRDQVAEVGDLLVPIRFDIKE